MVSHNDSTNDTPTPAKTLAGVGMVIAAEEADGTHKVLGIIFAPNVDKLKDLLVQVHGQKLTINLANVRGGTITLDKP